MEPGGLLQCSQVSNIGVCPDLDESTPYYFIPSIPFEIHFNIILILTSRFPQ
jgi:hypothetical protein